MSRYLIPLGLFLALLALLLYGLHTDPRRVPSPLIGKPLPDFQLPRLKDGDATVAARDLQGRVSLLNIWASWCVSCRHEHPLLLELARRREIAIYGLNYKDERAAALQWLRDLGDPYRMSAFDPAGGVGIDLGVYGVPETYLIDAQGVIRYKHIGPLTQRDWERHLLPLIKKLRGTI